MPLWFVYTLAYMVVRYVWSQMGLTRSRLLMSVPVKVPIVIFSMIGSVGSKFVCFYSSSIVGKFDCLRKVRSCLGFQKGLFLSKKGVRKACCLTLHSGSQSVIRCELVSRLLLHSLHIMLARLGSSWFTTCLCLLRKLCPVIHLIALL